MSANTRIALTNVHKITFSPLKWVAMSPITSTSCTSLAWSSQIPSPTVTLPSGKIRSPWRTTNTLTGGSCRPSTYRKICKSTDATPKIRSLARKSSSRSSQRSKSAITLITSIPVRLPTFSVRPIYTQFAGVFVSCLAERPRKILTSISPFTSPTSLSTKSLSGIWVTRSS